MWDAFHGATLDTISIGGEAIFRQNMGPLLPGTEHAPPPDEYRCVFGCNRRGGCDLTCAKYVEYILEKEGEAVMYAALSRGLSFKLTMGNILTLTPALTITREEMDTALGIIEESIAEVEKAP